jgi:tetratricopeptide (TPR) repeat protein
MRQKPDRAIADFDLAIELEPRNVVAYLDRGESLMHSGLYARAAADFDEVVRHDALPAVLRLRGLARFWSERYAEAARDLRDGFAARTIEDDILWLYLARVISGVDGMAELKASADRIDRVNAGNLERANAYRARSIDRRLEALPPLLPIPRDPVIRMYLRELTSGQAFDMVSHEMRSMSNLCRFHLFHAELLLSQPGDDRRRERSSLQEAIKSCDPNDLYYQFARSELKRLGQ